MNRSVKLGLVQMSCTGNPEQNMNKATGLIKEAAGNGARIILLQELFNALYFCQQVDESNFDLAEQIPGPSTEILGNLARDLEVVIVAPLFEYRAPGLYHNTAAVLDADGTYLGKYRKMHIPEDPGFHEKYYFTPGDLGYRVFNTRYAKIGVLICWDQWYPEAARITATMGAELLVYPTAIGGLSHESDEEMRDFVDAWEVIQRSHAIANGVFVASVNRTGTEGNIRFWGDSFVAGPFGKILARAGSGDEILYCDINPGIIEKQRRAWPYLRDRRIESYGPILKRFNTTDE
ncbi:MAG: carbon-nitrogen hydrolase [Rhodothermaceae bacterium]|nr:carbon-nitrogen hydrolase [Rhodothermaceae bacterium]